MRRKLYSVASETPSSTTPITDESPSQSSADISPKKNKGGRPKGSKTRPKWLRDQLAQESKARGPGRPKGAKNKPKTLEAFMALALEAQIPLTSPPKPKRKERLRGAAKSLVRYSPAKRSELARKAALARKPSQCKGRQPGDPFRWTTKQYAPIKEKARQEAREFFKEMDKQGLLPEDEIAREALLAALGMLREPSCGNKDLKLKVIRTLLEHTHPKPSQKQDITVRTAEDFLDELAAQEGDGE